MQGHYVGVSGEGKEAMCPDVDMGFWMWIFGVEVPAYEDYP